MYYFKYLTFCRSSDEQLLFFESNEHSLNVSKSIIPIATEDVQALPKFDRVFSKVM